MHEDRISWSVSYHCAGCGYQNAGTLIMLRDDGKHGGVGAKRDPGPESWGRVGAVGEGWGRLN